MVTRLCGVSQAMNSVKSDLFEKTRGRTWTLFGEGEVTVDDVIGSGAFGKVLSGRLYGVSEVAVKKFKHDMFVSEEQQQDFVEEVKMMRFHAPLSWHSSSCAFLLDGLLVQGMSFPSPPHLRPLAVQWFETPEYRSLLWCWTGPSMHCDGKGMTIISTCVPSFCLNRGLLSLSLCLGEFHLHCGLCCPVVCVCVFVCQFVCVGWGVFSKRVWH